VCGFVTGGVYRSHSGHTALLSAANSGQLRVVEWLVTEAGVDPAECNTNGDTALLLASFGS
jgi:ankyrin repeat protein